MRMIEIDYEAQPPIDGYGPGGFRVAGAWHDGGIILTTDAARPLNGAPGTETLADLIRQADDIDILLIGQGADIAPIPADLRQALDQAAIGVEVMSTPSACRTYNVLLTEDRRVAAALVPMPGQAL